MTKRIMSVDDSTSVRQLVAMTLTNAGYEVVTAEDGMDAVEKLKSSPVDMVLADLNMPRMDGISLVKHLRDTPAYRFIPIVLLTTESQEEKKAQGKAAGATGWIVKPFQQDQLLAVVKKVLG